jgi:thiaminase/transcriptional activator TenA
MGQDALFLKAYARAFSIAAAKAPDWQGVQAFHDQANGPIEELRLHEKTAQESWGELRDAEPGPATRRYTEFLLATAWGHDAGLTAVATLPCGRLYAFIGQQLARDGYPDHAYADWIRTYGGPEMEASAQQLEFLVDRYASDTPLVRSTYRYAMFCEREFFQAAWDYQAV